MTANPSSQAGREPRAAGRDYTGSSPKARAWRAFIETSSLLSRELEKRLQTSSGLRLSEYNVLLLLAEAPDQQLRMGDLASRMIFSPSRLSYQVKTLESRGLISRCTAAADRRGTTAQLTSEGYRVFTAAAARHGEQIRALFHPAIDGDQADQLRKICEQLQEHLAAPDSA